MADAAEGHGAIDAYEKGDLTRPQLSVTLQKLFGKDRSKEQALKILDACSPYQVTGHDTPSDVKRFLNDFEALRGKVSTLPAPITTMDEFFEQTSDCGRFSACVASLLYSAGCGEEFVAFRQMNFQQIWDLLREFGTERKRLNYLSTKNTPEKSTNEWKFFIKSKRPDNIILARGKVYLFGEEKEKIENFEMAVTELTNTIVQLPPAMYGKLKFVICYAAAGGSIQFFVLQLRKLDRKPFLTPVTEVLNVNLDTPRLVLFYIKLYFLLLGMDEACGPGLPFPLDTFFLSNHCRIKLTLDGAVKEILDFGSYAAAYGVRFEDLEAAYEAANYSNGHLITSVFGPHLESTEVDMKRKVIEELEAFPLPKRGSKQGSKRRSASSTTGSSSKKGKTITETEDVAKVTREIYKVETLPLCAEKVPECEQEMRDMAYGVLRGLKALHDAGYVHRDIRFPNIMYEYLEEKYLLIDLESVAKDGEVPVCRLKDWIGGTLENGNRYTKLSDFHQLGRLLKSVEVVETSKALVEFIDLLLSKTPGTTADTLLQHAWISQVQDFWQNGFSLGI